MALITSTQPVLDAELAPTEADPTIEVVVSQDAAAGEPTQILVEEPERLPIVRTCATSILAMMVIFFFAGAVPAWAAFDDLTMGLGIGAMSAIWMGPAFGVVTAGARLSDKLHD